MRANCWMGKNSLEVRDVPDPTIITDRDAVIKVTSTAICGSDLHLYEVMGPFIDEGFTLGHEPMGIVQEVGSDVPNQVLRDQFCTVDTYGEVYELLARC